MKKETFDALTDELEKIGFQKEAGLLRDIGMRISKTVKSVPGHARGAVQNAGSTISAFSTPIDSVARGLKATTTDFHTLSNSQKALLGFGLAGSAHEALSKKDPLGQNRGRIERAATVVGDQLGGLVGTPFGLTGGLVGGQVGRKAGKVVGKGLEAIHRATKKPTPAPATSI